MKRVRLGRSQRVGLGRSLSARLPVHCAVRTARRLAEAIWEMLTHHRPFAPAGVTAPLAA
jgi:hypothetical protein